MELIYGYRKGFEPFGNLFGTFDVPCAPEMVTTTELYDELDPAIPAALRQTDQKAVETICTKLPSHWKELLSEVMRYLKNEFGLCEPITICHAGREFVRSMRVRLTPHTYYGLLFSCKSVAIDLLGMKRSLKHQKFKNRKKALQKLREKGFIHIPKATKTPNSSWPLDRGFGNSFVDPI